MMWPRRPLPETDNNLQAPGGTYRGQRGRNNFPRRRQYLFIVRHRPVPGPPPPDAGNKMANVLCRARMSSASSSLRNGLFALALGALAVGCSPAVDNAP